MLVIRSSVSERLGFHLPICSYNYNWTFCLLPQATWVPPGPQGYAHSWLRTVDFKNDFIKSLLLGNFLHLFSGYKGKQKQPGQGPSQLFVAMKIHYFVNSTCNKYIQSSRIVYYEI